MKQLSMGPEEWTQPSQLLWETFRSKVLFMFFYDWILGYVAWNYPMCWGMMTDKNVGLRNSCRPDACNSLPPISRSMWLYSFATLEKCTLGPTFSRIPPALSIYFLNINTLVLCFIYFYQRPSFLHCVLMNMSNSRDMSGTSLCLNNRNKSCNTWRATIWSV
jgi:hypothetical protein